MLNFICVFVGCGIGGVCRYALSAYLLKTASAHFPWATFTANVAGCLIIGFLLGYFSNRPSQALQALTVAGFCGGFTTFSTFANETLLMLKQGSVTLAATYVLISILAGIVCVAAGYAIMRS